MVNIAIKCLQLHELSVYINHPDYDKGNLIIVYVTLDGRFSVTAILFTVVHIYSLQIYFLKCEHLGRCIKQF